MTEEEEEESPDFERGFREGVDESIFQIQQIEEKHQKALKSSEGDVLISSVNRYNADVVFLCRAIIEKLKALRQ